MAKYSIVYFAFKSGVIVPMGDHVAPRLEKKGEGKVFSTLAQAEAHVRGTQAADEPKRTKRGEE